MSGAPARPSHDAEAPEPCAVRGCGAPSVRHLALAEAKRGLEDLPDAGRRAPLCREHYKAWKKATRGSRALDRLGR